MEAMRCLSTDPQQFVSLVSSASADTLPASVLAQASEAKLSTSVFGDGWRHAISEWSQMPIAKALAPETDPGTDPGIEPGMPVAAEPVAEPVVEPVAEPAPVDAVEVVELVEPDPEVRRGWTWQDLAQHLVAREGSALAVAKRLGVTHPAVLGWVRGAKPQAKHRAALARLVGRDVEFFEVSGRQLIGDLTKRLDLALQFLLDAQSLVSVAATTGRLDGLLTWSATVADKLFTEPSDAAAAD